MSEASAPRKPVPIPAERIPDLRAALSAERIQIEHDRQTLRLKMAEVEQELSELTSQQAVLQKTQIAIDQLLSFLNSPSAHPSSTS